MDKTIKSITTSDYKLNRQLNYFGTKTWLEFRGSCLKQDKITFNDGKIVNIYIGYELDKTYVKTHPTLVNCLFRVVSVQLKILILIRTNILDTELDLIEVVFIYYLMVVLVEM